MLNYLISFNLFMFGPYNKGVNKSLFVGKWAALGLLASIASSASPVGYSFVDLGAGYFPYAVSSPLNNTDFIVAGTYCPSFGGPAPLPDDTLTPEGAKAFIYRKTTGLVQTFALPSGVVGMTSRSINASGRLVGTYTSQTFPNTFAYTLDVNGAQVISTLPTFATSPAYSYGINSSGNILCNSIGTPPLSIEGAYTVYLGSSPVVRQSPSMIRPQLRSGMGINDNDYITGQVNTDDGKYQMWLSQSSGYVLLGTLTSAVGTSSSFGYAVNNSNPPLAVGYNRVVDGASDYYRAVYYNGGTLTAIAPTKSYGKSIAFAVSDLGRIAGCFQPVGTLTDHAFIYTIGNNGVTDCNSFLSPAVSSVFTLSAVYGINKQGVIVGYGFKWVGVGTDTFPEYHGFVLKPI